MMEEVETRVRCLNALSLSRSLQADDALYLEIINECASVSSLKAQEETEAFLVTELVLTHAFASSATEDLFDSHPSAPNFDRLKVEIKDQFNLAQVRLISNSHVQFFQIIPPPPLNIYSLPLSLSLH